VIEGGQAIVVTLNIFREDQIRGLADNKILFCRIRLVRLSKGMITDGLKGGTHHHFQF